MPESSWAPTKRPWSGSEKRGEIEPEDRSGNLIVQLPESMAQRVVLDDGATKSTGKDGESNSATAVDKSVLAVAAPRRYRNREHLRSVIKMPCLVCGRKPSDPHHLRYAQPRAFGRKASDEFTVPLCRTHHRAVHRAGDERAWWKAAGIDPLKVAGKLWKEARVNDGRLAPNPPSNVDDQKQSARSPDPSGPPPV